MLNANRNDIYSKGQSLVEYGLAISLIAVVCIGGLMLMGDSFKGVISQTNAILVGSQSNATKPANANSNDSDAQSPAMQGPALKACLDAKCTSIIQVEKFDATRVAGANGVNMVREYANTLEKIADSLNQDPSSDPSIRALITGLAEWGHLIASCEQDLMNVENDKLITIEFEAQKTSVMDYLQQHPGALSPELAAIVTLAANNISDQYIDFLGGAVPYNTNMYNINEINQKYRQRADYVTGESNTICNSGGDTSQCVR